MSLALFLHSTCWVALCTSIFSLRPFSLDSFSLRLFSLYKASLLKKSLFVVCFYAITFIPIQGIPLVGYPLGILSDLSLTTTTLAGLSLLRLFRPDLSFSLANYRMIWMSVAVFAILFYPSSLGLIYLDAYSYGYHPALVLVLLCLAAVSFWKYGFYLPVMTILIALWGYNFRLLASDNLWDYLLDPILVGYAILQLSIHEFTLRSTPDGKTRKA